MQKQGRWQFIIGSIVIPAVIAVLTSGITSYIAIVNIKTQVRLNREQIISNSLWRDLDALRADINQKWDASREVPLDPAAQQVLDEAIQLARQARDKLREQQFDEAKELIKRSSELIAPLPGPPVIMEREPIPEWPKQY